MPLPTLTADEITQITKEKTAQEAAAATFTAQISAKTARITELQDIDSVFKRFFGYYDNDIVKQYDSEQQALNGLQITSPIIEADLIDAANLTGRLLPTPPATAIDRIPEFDGGGTITNPLNETQHNTNTSNISTQLKTGFGGGTATIATTTTSLTSSSETLNVTNTVAETITVNDVYVVELSGNLGVIRVDSIVDGGGGNPPYLSTLEITILLAPTTTVGTGASLIVFTGFNNSERTSKTASNGSLQTLMDSLVSNLESELSGRSTALNTQDTALDLNQDPDGIAQIATALGLNTIAKDFITNYLIGTDISDTGLGSLDTERTSRGTEISTRVAQIVANYTGQTENYYDKRYSFGNDRADQIRGTLRQQKITEASSVTSTFYGASATSAAASFSNILP